MPPVDDDLNWVTVDDFSPGIHQKVNRAYVDAQSSPNRAPGAATENTWRCISISNGGLGPLPRLINTTTIPTRDTGQLKFGCYMIVGVYVQGNVNSGANLTAMSLDNLFIALEWVHETGTLSRRFQMLRYRLFDPPNLDTIQSIVDTNATAAGDPGWVPCLMNTLRYSITSSTDPGSPGMVYTWISGAGEAGGTTGAQWKVFPDFNVGVGNTLTPATISNTVGVVGTVSGVHQERAISCGPVNYLNGSSTIAYQLNENIFHTEANLITGVNATAEVYEGQTSTGISFLQSMSADQLFVNKSSGGSYMVRGDLANPTVYRLPGVPSSKAVQIPAATQNGLFYCVLNNGLWVWGGGSEAQKVSDQLEDNFWGPVGMPFPGFVSDYGSTQGTTVPYNDQIPYYPFYNPYAGRLQHYNNWVLIPNNWLYDMSTRGFWKMDNPADFVTTPIMHWNRSMANDYLIGSPLYYVNAIDPIAYHYDPQLGAINYQWQSQPLPQSIDRSLDIRQFVLTAQGTGTVTVTLTGLNGNNTPTTSRTMTFTLTNNNYPEVHRDNVGIVGGGAFQSTYVQVTIEADSGSPTVSAPIIHRYSVGIKQRTHLP